MDKTGHKSRGRDRAFPCFAHISGIILTFVALALTACAPDVVKSNQEGNTHFEAQEYDEAMTSYRQAQVDEPDFPEPYYNAANTYNRQGQVDGALAQTEQALKTAEDPLAARAWYNLGNAYYDAQQWEQAIEAYKSSLRLDPEDADAKHNLELALEQQQQQGQEQQDQASDGQEQQEDQQDQEDQQSDEEQESQEQENQESQSSEEQNEEQGEQNQEQQTDAGEPTPQANAQPQETEMSPEEAQQLLMTLLSDSETLQEKLQEIYRVPGSNPAEDW